MQFTFLTKICKLLNNCSSTGVFYFLVFFISSIFFPEINLKISDCSCVKCMSVLYDVCIKPLRMTARFLSTETLKCLKRTALSVYLRITSDKNLSHLTSALDRIQWLALYSGRFTLIVIRREDVWCPQSWSGRGCQKKIGSCWKSKSICPDSCR
jgi:hypothetical protein